MKRKCVVWNEKVWVRRVSTPWCRFTLLVTRVWTVLVEKPSCHRQYWQWRDGSLRRECFSGHQICYQHYLCLRIAFANSRLENFPSWCTFCYEKISDHPSRQCQERFYRGVWCEQGFFHISHQKRFLTRQGWFFHVWGCWERFVALIQNDGSNLSVFWLTLYGMRRM